MKIEPAERVWECPECGLQLAMGESTTRRPPKCRIDHEPIEMEQRMLEAWKGAPLDQLETRTEDLGP